MAELKMTIVNKKLKSNRSQLANKPTEVPTGIACFDEITDGGLSITTAARQAFEPGIVAS